MIQNGAVSFENVSFGYNEQKSIIKGLSFHVQGGTKIGLVGTSGVGYICSHASTESLRKSTILRLLYRFFDPAAGSIKIDGQDIKGVTLDSLRKQIGVIPQDTVLFNETIYYNIAYGNPSATPEEVYEAAKKAQIHDNILGMADSKDLNHTTK